MNVFIDLIKEYFTYKFIEVLAAICGFIVTLSVYHLFNLWLSGKIRSVFKRRSTIWLVAIILYSIYYLMFETGRSIEVRDHDMRIFWVSVILSFMCFNLYYLFTCKLSDSHRRWIPAVKFFIMFLMFWLFMASMMPLINFTENMNRSLEDILIGNYHLSEENRIFFFKKELIFNVIVALEATSVDFACRYVLKLQGERKKIKELENIRLREKLTQAQLDALHAKINPHFLYNALNSIAGLALTDGPKTRKMAISLSKFFRYSINREQSSLVTAGEELKMIETYLEIEKIRFEDQLNYEIIIQPGLEEIKIPRFIMQPLVENCVKHGLKGDKMGVTIRIQVENDGNKLVLSIQDNGKPFTENLEPGYGLKSVYDKLDLLFPEKYEVALFNAPLKQVRIQIET